MRRSGSAEAPGWGPLLLASVPTGVLVLAYVWICVDAQTLWPWSRIVHESGTRTLLETILYFEHATRELPLDAVLALAAAAAFAHFVPPSVTAAGPLPARGPVRPWTATLAVTLTLILAGSLVDVGAATTLDNLLQKPIRDGVQAWGAHWRYHLLSRLALILLFFAVAGVLSTLAGQRSSVGAARPVAYHRVLALFGGLTLVFAPNLDPLLDAQHLGHQARELFTHTLVTVPATAAALWSAAPAARPSAETLAPRLRALPRTVWLYGAMSVVLCAYLAIGVLRTDAVGMGQSESLAHTVGGHFFEHAFTYVFVPAAAVVSYRRLTGRARTPSTPSTAAATG